MTLTSFFSDDLSLLHSIDIRLRDVDENWQEQDMVDEYLTNDFFSKAPCLREANLNDFTTSEIKLPWSQLEKLRSQTDIRDVYLAT